MLSISNLTYKIGARTILDNCTATVMDGWRVGVVGANGAGKSTLFKLISGDILPDGGTVSVGGNKRFAMVRQDIPETDTPLIDLVLSAHEEMAQLWRDAETETDGNKIADIYQRLSDLDAYAAPGRAATLLTGLGFKEHQLREPFSSFSGGWRMRVALASVLFIEPEILLLDEPTNHLDIEAIMWLENYLASYPHTLLVISHDRDLLNKCIDHVIHVDKQQMTLYTGDYDTFERERAMRLGLQQKMHEKQVAEKAHMQKFVDRFKAKASKARQAQSRMKAIEKMDMVDAVIADRSVRFTFPNPDKIGTPMISINHADIGYTEGNPVLKRVHQNIDNDDRIALLGANGNGKSTLIKLVAGKLEAMSGDMFRSSKLRIGYFSQHQTDELDTNSTPYLEMLKLMAKHNPDVREPVVRAKLGAFGFSRDLADNKIASLSGGEKARLLFAFMSFDAPHLLLLDEPTNHLDIDAREALVSALNAYEGAIIIVSHDPTMVERVADRLWL
ncbi:MAG: ATP-binding cassette domain-containing protein, partial [Alphaproteobacteria bacterium]|nr:ATP-binding cassette domain-containing protein [Alphaproteobacteria bacterium]